MSLRPLGSAQRSTTPCDISDTGHARGTERLLTKARRGLVQEHKRGATNQRDGHGQPALLTARQRVCEGVCFVRHPDVCNQAVDLIQRGWGPRTTVARLASSLQAPRQSEAVRPTLPAKTPLADHT